MKHDMIEIKGARENNLKNIDVKVPRNQFVIMTGVSGCLSGILTWRYRR